jgi:hypothetical protein
MKILLFFIFLLMPVLNLDAQCINVSDDAQPLYTTLSGHLLTEMDWGPPNYGESPKTDRKLKTLLLKLNHPISICKTTDRPAMTLDCVQVAAVNCLVPSSLLDGQNVGVYGFLYNADFANQVTPVLIGCKRLTAMGADLSPEKLAALKNYRCQSTGGGI